MSANLKKESSPATEAFNDSIKLGISEFNDLVKNPWYVDKTMFIKALIDGGFNFTLICAPRRFGKSTNMNMLKKFLEIEITAQGVPITNNPYLLKNRMVFENTNIFKDEQFFNKHFGTCPIIHVNFKSVHGGNHEEHLYQYRMILNTAYKQHAYLLYSHRLDKEETGRFKKYYDMTYNLTKTEMEFGLVYLSSHLYKHYNKKAYVLIDDYDAPVTNAIYNEKISGEDITKNVDFFCLLISNLLNGNDYVVGALLNGIHHVHGGILPFHANNIVHYPFLSKPYCKYYGFTKEEVHHLLEKSNLPITQLKDWYNGYSSTDGKVEIYNNWSILNYLSYGTIGNYWSSGKLTHIKKALLYNNETIKLLMSGRSLSLFYEAKLDADDIKILKKMIKPSPRKERDLFLQFLYEHGYLNIVNIDTNGRFLLQTPNTEIYNEFYKIVNEY